jgi:hypothetical protein
MVCLLFDEDMMKGRMLMKQNQVPSCLYTFQISAQINCSFKGSAVKGEYLLLSGFHQVALRYRSEWTLATGTQRIF